MSVAEDSDRHDPLGLRRRVTFDETHLADPERLLAREWLVTNGLGGYAAGTLAGVLTRRYHGLLIAALRTPLCSYAVGPAINPSRANPSAT